MKACIQSGHEQGQLTKEEADYFTALYDDYLKATGSPAQARALLLDEVERQIEQRKRVAFLANERRMQLEDEQETFRNEKGEIDLPRGYRLQTFKLPHQGRFHPNEADPWRGMSVEEIRTAEMGRVIRKIEQAMHEFNGGFLSGGMRRSSKMVAKVSPKAAKVQARMENVQREMRGVKTGDERAAFLAKLYMDTAEELRLEYNRLGGVIGKLDDWGGPQKHRREVIMQAAFNGKRGQAAWVDYMMQDGVLDTQKMLHPITEKPYTPAQLSETLKHAWLSITTDGMHGKEITGVPVGRGALWKRHADHRFLHFTPEGWIKYAKDFGDTDFHAAMMFHYATMVRDIAAMRKFGPNPDVMRTYLEKRLLARSEMVQPVAAIIADQTARMKQLAASVSEPNPEYERLSDELGKLTAQVDAIRKSRDGRMLAEWERQQFFARDAGADDVKASSAALAARVRIDELNKRMIDIVDQLAPYWDGSKPTTSLDASVRAQMDALVAEMREPVTFAKSQTDPRSYAESSIAFTNAMWQQMRGNVHAPLVADMSLFGTSVRVDVAKIFENAWNIIAASSLHSAVLSAVSDPANAATRMAHIGIAKSKAQPIGVLKDVIRYMAQPENRRYAAQAGVLVDTAIGAWQAPARYMASIDMRLWTGFVAERVLHIQGLLPFTSSIKAFMADATMLHVAQHVQLGWSKLPAEFRQMLEAGGFTEGMWDTIRAVPLHERADGVFYLRAPEIEQAAGLELSLRYQSMILGQVAYASPEGNPLSRATLLGGTNPGTVAGILARSFAQFKSFPVAVVMLQFGQMMSELHAGRRSSAAQYVALLFLYGTFMGALATALKDIKDGRDPKKWLDDEWMADPAFWGAAALQGGGLGIYGDFLFSNVNRYGGGLPETIAGPVWGRIDNLRNLTVGNLVQLAQGKDTNFGAEFTRFLRQNMPNVWMTKLATDRLIMDQLQMLLDKDADRAFRRWKRSRKKDYNQDLWWDFGKTFPHRTPDLSRIGATR